MDDRNLALEMIRVTEAAALSSARLMGRGDRDAADAVAVEAMRMAFDHIDVRGTVVIGEGERDEAPMLYIGERVGKGWHHPQADAQADDADGAGDAGAPDAGSGDSDSPRVDIAVDPLEGTNLCATGAPDAIAVIALADDGKFLNAPDTYMKKIAVGPEARGAIDLRESWTWNLRRIAEAKNMDVRDLTVIILSRPRHETLIAEVREAGSRIRLIGDGDVSAAIATCKPETGIDALFGTGGAPEGVIAAAALRCVGGDLQGQLQFRSDAERERAYGMGVPDESHLYSLEELAAGNVMFAATGVTQGSFLSGVNFFSGGATTQSVVMRSKSGTVRVIDTTHRFDTKPRYSWATGLTR